jgi:hypothetical protein
VTRLARRGPDGSGAPVKPGEGQLKLNRLRRNTICSFTVFIKGGSYLYSTFRNMQLPTVSEHGAELEGKMGKLDISRNQPGPQPGPSQIDHSTRSLTGTDGASGSSSQHHRRRDQARSSSQSSEGGVRKTSKGEVWYLKTIVFTSPSGVRRKYNIITQNYNGCVL